MQRPLLYLASLALLALPLAAATYRHEKGGVSLWLPDDWSVDIADDYLKSVSPDGDVTVHVWSHPKAADLDAAYRTFRSLISARAGAYRETRPRRDIRVNGMSGVAREGEVSRYRVARPVRVVILEAPRSTVVLLWSATASGWERRKGDYERITGSIRPAD